MRQNIVCLHYRFTKTRPLCRDTICCWSTSLGDGALTSGGACAPPPGLQMWQTHYRKKTWKLEKVESR